jgi:hypothetical protein
MSRSQHADLSGVSPAGSSEPIAYVMKQLDTLEELVQSYRLRYKVYGDLGYLRHPNISKLLTSMMRGRSRLAPSRRRRAG